MLYGASEFSRDTDLAILAGPENLTALRRALSLLGAREIAVPPLALKHLRRGHAVHVRCSAPGVAGMRVDLMSVMRGLPSFAALWKRRTTVTLAGGARVDLLSLPDLVQAKKTQRDKDWPMIRRLVEADYRSRGARPKARDIRFWLREGRTVALLRELATRFPEHCRAVMPRRPLLGLVASADEREIERALLNEELAERAADQAYWQPLRRELEAIRRSRRMQPAKDALSLP